MEVPLHQSCALIRSHACGLLAIDKAEGILSHPNKGKSGGACLLSAQYDHAEEAYVDAGNKWYLLNRLDAPTSGLILLATDLEVAVTAKAAFASHSVKKSYLALVKGIPVRKKDCWRDCLMVDRKGGLLRTRVVQGKANSESVILLKQRGEGPPARALIQLDPVTGRTHQLRVQCSNRRLPIAGDATYGDFSFNRDFRKKTGTNRLFLHSWKTELEILISGKKVIFTAESAVPGIFAIALQ